jgi:hypothetical protein
VRRFSTRKPKESSRERKKASQLIFHLAGQQVLPDTRAARAAR